MREIKFRAWDLVENLMVQVYEVRFQPSGFDWSGLWWINWHYHKWMTNWPLKDYVLQQYTWLKDKNWKEIYEGDILSIPISFCEICNQKEMRLVVERDNWNFIMSDNNVTFNKDHSWNYDSIGMIFPRDYFIVIWNIYENPELIKV